MVNSPEVLEHNWSESREFKRPTFEQKLDHFWLKKEDYSAEEFSALKERFESHLSLYERPAELNMQLLEKRVDATLDTAEKRKIAFKDWISEVESVIPKIDSKIPTSIDEAKKIVSERVEKKLFEKLPFLSIFAGTGIGASIVSFVNDIRKESWFFGWLISKWLNIDTELNEHDKIVTELTENQAITEIPDEAADNKKDVPESIPQGNIDDAKQKAESVSEDIEVSPENLRESFKISGGIFLREMSGVIFDKRTSGWPGIIYEALGNIEYSDIADQFNNFIEEKITYSELLNNLNLGSQWTLKRDFD